MTKSRKFTLAESLEANDALAKEVQTLLGVAADDVFDTYGDDTLVNLFHTRNESGAENGSHTDTRTSKLFARALVERLLWSRDSGLILDYDPDAEYVRVTHPPTYPEESE